MKKFLTSTGFLTNGMLFVGLIVISGESILFQQIYGVNIPEKVDWILAGSICIFIFVGFFFIFLRKEIVRPGLSSIKGGIAVAVGAIGSLITGSVELYCIYNLIFK
jgi:hypothetical protein